MLLVQYITMIQSVSKQQNVQQVTKLCKYLVAIKRGSSSSSGTTGSSHVIRTLHDGESELVHVNKIPTIKGFDILRNPKLNKVID